MDSLQVERERGITVKSATATLFYTHQGEEYLINLIDTHGARVLTGFSTLDECL
jgi:translation elongation factor EF-4